MSKRTLPALLGVGAALAVPVAASGAPYQHTPNATELGTGGAAATVDSVATGAARDVLRKGGNAVDAAVAAAAVLGVTEPYSSGIGGGGFMLIRRPNGKVTTIDSRETAPRAMRGDSFIENGAPLAFSDARYSGLSAGVPGTVAGWSKALKRYGTWNFKRALAPAIDVAREGFVVDQTFTTQTEPNVPWFDDIPATAELYLDPDGTARDPGSVVKNPDMARTYERIARDGARRGFYRGPVAEALVRAARRPRTAPDRRQDVAARADHGAGPARLPRDRPQADPRRLPRARRLLDGPAVLGRLDRRRGAQHPGADPGLRGDAGGREAALLPRGLALRVRRPQRLRRRPGVLRRPAARAAVRQLRGGARGADRADRPQRGGPRRRPERQPRHDEDRVVLLLAGPVDDAPHRRRPPRHRRQLHVHDRVDRRQRDRRPGLGLPAQQRADGLQLRQPGAPERAGRRQAAALVDGADLRRARRAPAARGRLARRRDDHHHGAPDPHGADRLRADPARRRSPTRARASATPRRPRRTRTRRRRRRRRSSSAGARRCRRAATRSAPRRRSARRPGSSSCPAGGCMAAAEPVRRGGGSAEVVNP